jgi:hypothetical protein
MVTGSGMSLGEKMGVLVAVVLAVAVAVTVADGQNQSISRSPSLQGAGSASSVFATLDVSGIILDGRSSATRHVL